MVYLSVSWCGGSGYIARPCTGSLLRRASRCAAVVWTSPAVGMLRDCTSRA